jgi:hypothetical protein
VGADLGYGKTCFDEYFFFDELFGDYTYNNLRLGLTASLNPHQSVLFLNTGLSYQRIGNKGNALNFLQIPFGFDIAPGRKLKFFFGGGGFVSYLFLLTGTIDPDINRSKRDFQIGLYMDVGFRYQINNNWSVIAKMQMDFDCSTLYKESIPDHFGGYYYEVRHSYDYSVDVGFRYLIPQKKNGS